MPEFKKVLSFTWMFLKMILLYALVVGVFLAVVLGSIFILFEALFGTSILLRIVGLFITCVSFVIWWNPRFRRGLAEFFKQIWNNY
jgi:hypothetical protein